MTAYNASMAMIRRSDFCTCISITFQGPRLIGWDVMVYLRRHSIKTVSRGLENGQWGDMAVWVRDLSRADLTVGFEPARKDILRTKIRRQPPRDQKTSNREHNIRSETKIDHKPS